MRSALCGSGKLEQEGKADRRRWNIPHYGNFVKVVTDCCDQIFPKIEDSQKRKKRKRIGGAMRLKSSAKVV